MAELWPFSINISCSNKWTKCTETQKFSIQNWSVRKLLYIFIFIMFQNSHCSLSRWPLMIFPACSQLLPFHCTPLCCLLVACTASIEQTCIIIHTVPNLFFYIHSLGTYITQQLTVRLNCSLENATTLLYRQSHSEKILQVQSLLQPLAVHKESESQWGGLCSMIQNILNIF
jgi:hypothetical protein